MPTVPGARDSGRDSMIARSRAVQYGVVSRAQLLAAGIGQGAIATPASIAID